nr:phage head-tail connector protein [[Eubacterium] tenue]
MVDQVKILVKSKLDFNKIEMPDDIIDLVIEEANENIKRYCNIDEVPKELKFVLVSMSFDILTNQYVKNDDEVVESIQQGDTKISFKNPSEPLNSKNILNQYIKDLNKFRRLKK